MQDTMTDSLAEASKVVQKRLSLGAKFVLIRLSQVSPVESGKIGVGMECCDNEAAFGMQHAVPFLQCDTRGKHIWQRQIAHQSIQRAVSEWKGIRPVGLNPSNGERWHGRQATDKASSKFPLQDSYGIACLADCFSVTTHTDHERRGPPFPARLSGAIRVIDQCRTGQVTLPDPGIDKDRTWIERAHQAVKIVQQLSVLMQISDLRKL